MGNVDGHPFLRVGWGKHNGCGEIIYRQCGHPANDEGLPAQGWEPLVREAEAEALVADTVHDLLAANDRVARLAAALDESERVVRWMRQSLEAAAGHSSPLLAGGLRTIAAGPGGAQ